MEEEQSKPLNGVRIKIDEREVALVPDGAADSGDWYEYCLELPLSGSSVKLETTTPDELHLEQVEVQGVPDTDERQQSEV